MLIESISVACCLSGDESVKRLRVRVASEMSGGHSVQLDRGRSLNAAPGTRCAGKDRRGSGGKPSRRGAVSTHFLWSWMAWPQRGTGTGTVTDHGSQARGQKRP